MATQQLRPQGGLPGARPSLSHSREVAAAALSWLKPRLQGWPWTPLWWSSTVCPVHFPCHFRKDRGLVPSPFPSGSPSPPPHGRPTSLSATLYVLAILTERPATFHMERRRQPGSLSGDSVGPSAGTLLWARGVGVRGRARACELTAAAGQPAGRGPWQALAFAPTLGSQAALGSRPVKMSNSARERSHPASSQQAGGQEPLAQHLGT